MAVKCGNCKNYHEDAAGVKACFQGTGFGPVTATLKAEAAVQAAEAPATEKQLGYLKALLADRPGWASRQTELVVTPGYGFAFGLTKRAASYWIGEAKKVPAEPKPDGNPTPTGASYMPEIEDGIYRDGAGTYWKVYHTIHGNNSQVAKKLIIIPVEGSDPQTYTYEFEYIGKRGLKGLTAEMRLDEAAAKDFGKVYGFCVFGHALNRDESLYVGYGKTCAAKNGWWYPTAAELRRLRESETAIA